MQLRSRAFTLIELMIVITIIAILVAILVPNLKHARARAQLSTCVGQCKNMATALELYAVDSEGRYPNQAGMPGIDILIAHSVLKRYPTCPSAGVCTFTDFNTTQTPDSFSFTCVGNNHGDCWPGIVVGNLPQYSNDGGPVIEP